jgi:hypothetical protein
LRNLLKDKSVLLILDDVWNAKHVYYFQTHGTRFCRVLLTTRYADIGKATGAQSYRLDVLTKELSCCLLANYAALSEDELPREADGLIHECDGLPLALAMIGATLRDEPIRDGQTNSTVSKTRIWKKFRFSSLLLRDPTPLGK